MVVIPRHSAKFLVSPCRYHSWRRGKSYAAVAKEPFALAIIAIDVGSRFPYLG
jgi:hypothetical protein